jgi:hypothetical protein
MSALYLAACAIVFTWSSYCVLSPHVHDGLIGKLLFSTAAVAAAAQLMGAANYTAAVLAWALALLCVRQALLKLIGRLIGRRTHHAQDHA